jgi:hypothetical protein
MRLDSSAFGTNAMQHTRATQLVTTVGNNSAHQSAVPCAPAGGADGPAACRTVRWQVWQLLPIKLHGHLQYIVCGICCRCFVSIMKAPAVDIAGCCVVECLTRHVHVYCVLLQQA